MRQDFVEQTKFLQDFEPRGLQHETGAYGQELRDSLEESYAMTSPMQEEGYRWPCATAANDRNIHALHRVKSSLANTPLS